MVTSKHYRKVEWSFTKLFYFPGALLGLPSC